MRTPTMIHVSHAAELCVTTGPNPGPTGEFREVVRGELRDHGGNLLFAGTADACVRERRGYRIPTRLVPTETRATEFPIAGADHTWGFCS